MPLNDVAIRAAKPGLKPVKLSDEKGLFLLVAPSGGKLWRLKYRIGGKEKKLALGSYPDVALKDARERSAEARKLIAAGIDPSEKKRIDRLDATLKAATTFKAVADEYIGKCEREGRADVTVGKARWLLSLLEPALGLSHQRSNACRSGQGTRTAAGCRVDPVQGGHVPGGDRRADCQFPRLMTLVAVRPTANCAMGWPTDGTV